MLEFAFPPIGGKNPFYKMLRKYFKRKKNDDIGLEVNVRLTSTKNRDVVNIEVKSATKIH